MSIKNVWKDVSLVLWDFSQGSKHCISRFIFEISAFAPMEIPYPNIACNKSAAEYVQFLSMVEYGGAKDLLSHVFSLE